MKAFFINAKPTSWIMITYIHGGNKHGRKGEKPRQTVGVSGWVLKTENKIWKTLFRCRPIENGIYKKYHRKSKCLTLPLTFYFHFHGIKLDSSIKIFFHSQLGFHATKCPCQVFLIIRGGRAVDEMTPTPQRPTTNVEFKGRSTLINGLQRFTGGWRWLAWNRENQKSVKCFTIF